MNQEQKEKKIIYISRISGSKKEELHTIPSREKCNIVNLTKTLIIQSMRKLNFTSYRERKRTENSVFRRTFGIGMGKQYQEK